MSTQLVTIKGIASWAKVFPENRDMFEYNEDTNAFDKPSSTDGTYKISVEVQDEEYKKVKRSGSLSAKHSKESENGLEVLTFKRQHTKRGAGGKVLSFASGSPEVVNEFDHKWDFESDGKSYNGSEVEVTLAVYTTKFSPGTRLEKVKVLSLAAAPEAREESLADDVAF